MDQSTLIDKLRRIESLHAGVTTPGEKDAAQRARQRILERLAQGVRRAIAALRHHPYRYKRQRHTAVMARVSEKFVG